MPINPPDIKRAHATGSAPARVPPFASLVSGPPRWWGGSWWARAGSDSTTTFAAPWQEIDRARELAPWGPPFAPRDDGDRQAVARVLDAHPSPIAVMMSDGRAMLARREPGGDVVRESRRPISTLGELAPPPSLFVQGRHPRGRDGIMESARKVRDRILRDRLDRRVIADARRTIHAASLPYARGYPEPDLVVHALFEDQKKRAAFIADPTDAELVGSTVEILCLDPDHCDCWRAGDCDDQLVALGSRCATLGIDVWLRIRRYQGAHEAHIDMLYDSDRRRGRKLKAIDPSVEDGVSGSAPYVEEIIIEVTTMRSTDGGAFVGSVGSPSDALALGEASTLGAPETLSPDESSATMGWIASLSAQLQASADRFRGAREASRKVREAYGLPQYDPPAPPEQGQAPQPLHDYLRTGSYTQATDQAESKLLATADFMGDVVDDALAGRRAVNWDTSDALGAHVWIANKPGDPFGVRVVNGPNGGVTLAWTDDHDQVTGTLGLPPLLIGIAIVAGAAVVIGAIVLAIKVMDASSQKHSDDAVSQIVDQENQAVKDGKQTPEQKQANLKAIAAVREAYNPPKQESPTIPTWVWQFAAALVGLGIGVMTVKAGLLAPSRRNAAGKGASERSSRGDGGTTLALAGAGALVGVGAGYLLSKSSASSSGSSGGGAAPGGVAKSPPKSTSPNIAKGPSGAGPAKTPGATVNLWAWDTRNMGGAWVLYANAIDPASSPLMRALNGRPGLWWLSPSDDAHVQAWHHAGDGTTWELGIIVNVAPPGNDQGAGDALTVREFHAFAEQAGGLYVWAQPLLRA